MIDNPKHRSKQKGAVKNIVSPRWGFGGREIAFRAFPRPAILCDPAGVKVGMCFAHLVYYHSLCPVGRRTYHKTKLRNPPVAEVDLFSSTEA